MRNFYKSSSRGIGLIEILITTVVIAVGLLAIASLQGGLTGSSRVNKTRSEAKAICDTKLEELRDTLIQTDFTALATGNDTVTGSNEVITRNWGVTNLTAPVRKQISVTCTWPGTGDASERRVLVQSIISFKDLGASSQAALTAGTGGLNINNPSTNANSSDEINDATDIAIPDSAVADANGLFRAGIDGLEEGQYVKDNDGVLGDDIGSVVFLCSDLIPFENNLFTRRVHYKPTVGAFKEAIELFEDNFDSLTCTRRIRFNGGIILALQGIVYSRATTGSGQNTSLLELRDSSNTELFTFNATESGSFCVFNPETEATSAPYICYVGGNCVNGPVGTTKTTDGTTFSDVTSTYNENTIVTQCPDPFDNTTTATQPYPTAVYQQVGPGGWRGKVGLLGIAESTKNVCFSEELIEIAQQQADQHTLDTARNYFTRRVNNSVNTNEGINRSYNCHDMIIINGQSTTVQVHDECIEEAASIVGLGLASKNIQRNISGTTANNVILTTDTTFCANNVATAYTISGTISNAVGTPTVSVSDGVLNITCTLPTATTYSCSITTAANSVTMTATDDNGLTDCFITPPGSSGCDLVFTPPAENQRTVTATVIGTGTGTISNVIVTGTTPSDADCTGTECIVADTFTGTLTATADCSGTPETVTANSATIAVNDVTTTITLPACTSAVASHTISGTISIDNQVDDLTTISVNINGSICGGSLSTVSNTSGSYSCTILDGTTATFEITISPVCTGNKKTTISSGNAPSTGTGVLTYSLGVITADQVVNGSITRSSTNCN